MVMGSNLDLQLFSALSAILHLPGVCIKRAVHDRRFGYYRLLKSANQRDLRNKREVGTEAKFADAN